MLPCTFEGCGRPAKDNWVLEIISLYQDCKERKALPKAGGVLDQPADIMTWFRILDERIAEFNRKKQQEREKAENGRRIG